MLDIVPPMLYVEGMETWYTLKVGGHAIDGSTDDRAEAEADLAYANQAHIYDGEAYIVETEEPIA